jgi:drug/metabolite transporter (DMT)-like permease
MAWVWLVLLYGALKGTREIAKKKAVRKNTALEVLFFYTLLSFLIVAPDAKNAMGLAPHELGLTAVKSFIIFIGWMGGFYALERMPVSLYGVLDLSQMIFSTLLGVICLGEKMLPMQIAGLVLVTGGLLMLRGRGGIQKSEAVSVKVVGMAMVCYLFNAISGTMDKVLMRDMTSAQLQFWYMMFLSLWYVLYVLVRRTSFDWKNVLKNYWVWIMAVLIVVGDRLLFIANGMEGSRVTVMTLLKQIGCVVTIIGGRIVFKEKNIGYKLLCAGVVIVGIMIAVM